MNLRRGARAAKHWLGALHLAWPIADARLLVVEQVVGHVGCFGAALVLAEAGKADVEGVAVLAGQLSAVGLTGAWIFGLGQAEYVVGVVGNYLTGATTATTTVVIGGTRGNYALSVRCALGHGRVILEHAAWTRALTTVVARIHALSGRLWYGLRRAVLDPPGAVARHGFSAQKLEFGARKAAIEHVAPAAWVETVGFACVFCLKVGLK